MVQELNWQSEVELQLLDGSSLGRASLLVRRLSCEGNGRCIGELHTPIRGDTKVWPDNQILRLRLDNGNAAEVSLQAGVQELGPVLLQVARVRAEPGALEALIS